MRKSYSARSPGATKIQNPKSKIQNQIVGVDASRAVTSQRTGTEHYSASLLEALSNLPEAQSHQFRLYVNLHAEAEAQEKLGFSLPPNWQLHPIPFPRLWTHLRLSAEMASKPPGTLFVPSHVVPLYHPRRTVVTIHDLGYLFYPQAHTRLSRLYLHLSTIFSVRAARRVIAISEATKRDLITRYKVPSRKITVVYHGRDTIFSPVTDNVRIDEVRARYGLHSPYCIHVGTLQPRKNLEMLVRAWDRLRNVMDHPPQLLLAGKRGWLYDVLLSLIKEHDLGSYVTIAAYVQREDLPALYSGALAMVFPSLYEGFGLPPLEAMSCGTPVIASTASSIPEVVGDAGILLDPTDTRAWFLTILRLTQDPNLRHELSTKGLARASQFTWQRCARQTLVLLTR